MLTLEIHHTGGLYPQRLVSYFRSRGGQVEEYEAPRNLPMIIDEPEEYLPADAGRADVVLAVHMHSDLVVEFPDLMAAHGGKALIVPVEDPDWARPGLVRQVSELCKARGLECEFPKPFCALTPRGPVLKQFADEYEVGKPELVLTQRDGRVVSAECRQGAPCGLTAAAAAKLVGTDLSHETLEIVHSLHATYPCLGTMAMDPALGDTVMHLSVGLLYEAVQEAVKKATKEEQ